MSDTAGTASTDELWNKRWVMAASLTVTTAAVVLIVVQHRTGWSWPLFLGGLAIGLVALAVIVTLFAVGWRRQELTADQQLRLRRRLVLYSVIWIWSGALCGTLSAAFVQVWIDIGVAIYVVLSFGAGGLYFYRRQRAAAADDEFVGT